MHKICGENSIYFFAILPGFFDKINKTVGQDINSRMQIGILDIMPLSLLRITGKMFFKYMLFY
jgi:hypothetical protein